MYEEYLVFAKQIALEAGQIMKDFFNQDYEAHYKSDNTIVTEADTKINELVIKRIKEKYIDHGIYGEEASFNKEKKMLWVCDPIDGTSMFSRGVPVAVFSLAFVVDGVPQVGVVYDPFTDSLYEAVKGYGVKCNGKSISVNDYDLNAKESTIGYDYSPTMPFNTTDAIYPLSNKCRIGGTGSFVHNAILVANGGFSCAVTSGDRPYDIAAIKVIVEEAGGKVTDLNGKEQRYDREILGAVISNGLVHENLIEILRDSAAAK